MPARYKISEERLKHLTEEPVFYDPTTSGPLRQRTCTDILCCILFILFLAGEGAIAVYAYNYGDPRVLMHPRDSDGYFCGLGPRALRSKLLFFDLTECARLGIGVFVDGCPTPTVCVDECPQENYVAFPDAVRLGTFTARLICTDTANKNERVSELVKTRKCAPYILKSMEWGSVCLPELSKFVDIGIQAAHVITRTGMFPITDGNNRSVTMEAIRISKKIYKAYLNAMMYKTMIMNDVYETWNLIAIAYLCSMIICLLYIIIMRWMAAPIVIAGLLGIVALFGSAAGFCFVKWKKKRGTEEFVTFPFGKNLMKVTFEVETLFNGLAILMTFATVLIIIVFLALINRIRMAIALIKEGSRAMGKMMSTILFPIFPFALQVCILLGGLAITVYLVSISKINNDNNIIMHEDGSLNEAAVMSRVADLFEPMDCQSPTNDSYADNVCDYVAVRRIPMETYLHIFNFFMMFWCINFVIAIGEMSLSGAFAAYYWSWNKTTDLPKWPLFESTVRTLRYHIGTAAFGALIMAFVQIGRLVLQYCDSKLKAADNGVAKVFTKVLTCCFWCLENFLRFINTNAYIMTAIYGRNFCNSARTAFLLILRNVARVGMADSVADFFIFLGELNVVSIVGIFTYKFFQGEITALDSYVPNNLNFNVVPIFIIVFGAWMISRCFFSVYEIAIDTMFLCFLEDLERHDGSVEKPYFMSQELLKIFGKKNELESPIFGIVRRT